MPQATSIEPQKEKEIERLVEKALRFLSFRPRSERELHNHLRAKIPKRLKMSADGVIGNVLDRLKHLGYVNDLEFAKWWLEQRQTHKPRGLQLIRSELYQKGVAKEIVDEVLGGVESPEGEVELALQAAKKKSRSYQNLKPQEFKQKMGQYLARRGFDWEVIREAVDRLTGSRRISIKIRRPGFGGNP